MHCSVVIVGGGVTGVATARALEVDASLYERDAHLGGCLRSDTVGGYTIDRTGHLLHFRDPYVRKLMFEELAIDWIHFERRASVHLLDRRIPYPIQYNLHALPDAARTACLADYTSIKDDPPPLDATFDHWSSGAYGRSLHELFFAPYNRKLWQVDLGSMSAEWAARFVPMPDRDLVLGGAHRPHGTANFGYNAQFCYPSRGGSGAIVNALAEGVTVPMHTGVELIGIDPVAKMCTFSSGAPVSYDVLVSTIPLPSLVRRIHRADPEIVALADGLRHNSVFYFAFGFRVRGAHPPEHWIYVPEERFAPYRVGLLSAYSPHVAPEGSVLVCAEIGCPAGTAAHLDPAALQDRVLGDLVTMGVVKPDWTLDLVHHGSIDCAYVIYDAHRRTALPRIQAYLDSLGILSVGRYGAWGYGSMGDAVVEARDTAARVHAMLGDARRAART